MKTHSISTKKSDDIINIRAHKMNIRQRPQTISNHHYR